MTIKRIISPGAVEYKAWKSETQVLRHSSDKFQSHGQRLPPPVVTSVTKKKNMLCHFEKASRLKRGNAIGQLSV